ncbi:MAG TPA: hypothetical protein VFG20_02685 [Planctomycetaceae bacterium]|nr:hypothetical protein [Planctomycetaceae bacterium]
MKPEDDWALIHKPVTLTLKVIHNDKAGETWSVHRVEAEVADVDADRTAWLVTRDGIPIGVPVTQLLPRDPTESMPHAVAYLAGHELYREFHPHAGEARTTRRWLDRAEIEGLLNDL